MPEIVRKIENNREEELTNRSSSECRISDENYWVTLSRVPISIGSLLNESITEFFLAVVKIRHFYLTAAPVETINLSTSRVAEDFIPSSLCPFNDLFFSRPALFVLFFPLGFIFTRWLLSLGIRTREFTKFTSPCVILINRHVSMATFNLRIDHLYAMRHVIGTSGIGAFNRGKRWWKNWI